MFNIISKIIRTSKNLVTVNDISREQAEILAIGKGIDSKVKKLFRGSLAVKQVDAGSDNSAEQELVALSNSFYDAERFGVHFVASPKHADMLMVTGPVTRNMAEALKRAYASTPTPRIVIAVGDEAINGGLFNGSYTVYDKVADIIPVDYVIPGNPPSPKVILAHLLKILEAIDNKSLDSR